MKREAKSDHQFELHIAKTNSGFTAAEWASPLPRRARIASEGHALMTANEYRTHRMFRRASTTTRRDVAVERCRARRAR